MFYDRKGRSKTGKDVLKQKNEVLKQEILSHFWKKNNSFCPGTSQDRGVCPGTFAPALFIKRKYAFSNNFIPWFASIDFSGNYFGEGSDK